MQPFFLPGEKGQRFCLYHPPKGVARGAVIYLHPFAEEMNKARRMAGIQARAMAEAGYAVLQIDLLGCGDSAGDFSDATWSAWQDDVVSAYRWLRKQTNAPLTLWGLRTGCLLAASSAVRLPEKVDFLFWQPVVSGKQFWQQFMRLKMAGELASGVSKGIAAQLRSRLAAGLKVEIAGYMVSPELVDGLDNTALEPPAGREGRVIWLETSLRDEATLAPVSLIQLDNWRASGFAVHADVVYGPAFWHTSEIEDAPELISATQAAFAA